MWKKKLFSLEHSVKALNHAHPKLYKSYFAEDTWSNALIIVAEVKSSYLILNTDRRQHCDRRQSTHARTSEQLAHVLAIVPCRRRSETLEQSGGTSETALGNLDGHLKTHLFVTALRRLMTSACLVTIVSSGVGYVHNKTVSCRGYYFCIRNVFFSSVIAICVV